MTIVRRRFRIDGVVQGVGFRPFVERLARRHRLAGHVRNEAAIVLVEVEGRTAAVAGFERDLPDLAPPLARIDTITVSDIDVRSERDFRITPSRNDAVDAVIRVAPDAALCDDCRRELLDPTDRRFRHPFITCTNCGPRFTIIESLPYDRPNTTMKDFPMCEQCSQEYVDADDRRHHAQPIACPDCGPQLDYRSASETGAGSGTDAVLAGVLTDLAEGRIVAIKGVGGYHLAVDATIDSAVERLRTRKGRADKPFAVMVRDLDAAAQLAHVDENESRSLQSPAHPIVLLRARDDSPLSELVAPDNPLIGVMLSYSPLHRLLFEPVPDHAGVPAATALVMTSGNRSGEPICADDTDAFERLARIADSFCTHDRSIHRPCDDSVVRLVDGAELPIRRSRGYAPLPVRIPVPVAPTVAVGGELKNAVAVADGHHAWLSQHLGDMETLATVQAFERTSEELPAIYDIRTVRIAVDLHPDYHSTRWGRAHAESHHLDLVPVQHHHAHLASLMAEHDLDDGQDIIGYVFDGTGYGPDGTSWGGEILIGGYAKAERWGHLSPVLLPAGDSAANNPCRTALALLHAAGVEWSPDLAPARACGDDEITVLRTQLDRSLNCVTSSSMGRLFDAIASLLDVRHRITYEAQAAIELEILATQADTAAPMAFRIDGTTIDPDPIVRAVIAALDAGRDRAEIALGFHRAVADAIAGSAETIRAGRGLDVVGLTGGVFQNELLVRLSAAALRERGFTILTHRLVPPNDGGLALGQVLVAAFRGRIVEASSGRGDFVCV